MSSDVISWRNNGKLTTHTLSHAEFLNPEGGWLVVVLLKWKTLCSWLWHESGFLKCVCKYTEHCGVSSSRKASEKRHAWLNLFLNLLTFMSHAWISMLFKYGVKCGYHDNDTHTYTQKCQNLSTLRVFWGHGLLVYCKEEGGGERESLTLNRGRGVWEREGIRMKQKMRDRLAFSRGATHSLRQG